MKVLSLFDGMACGLTALKRAGIKISEYHAFEIDKYAIQIAMKNHPEIIQHGAISSETDFSPFKDFDLLIGGSPCQGFSFAGKGLNFNDPRSKLFFEFVRAKNEIQPKYFLLENVRMKKEHLAVISESLGVQPVLINSALVSAQNRQRYYWCNWQLCQPADRGILLKDIIETGDVVFKEKSQTILSTIYKENAKSMIKRNKTGLLVRDKSKCVRSSGRNSFDRHEWDPVDSEHLRKLTPLECERLQTLPDNYTQEVSDTQRYKMLGNGWTVDVIAHIFKTLNEQTQ